MPPRRKKEKLPCCKKRTPTPSPSNKRIDFRSRTKSKPRRRKLEPGKQPSLLDAAGVDVDCACRIVSRALNPKRDPPEFENDNTGLPVVNEEGKPTVIDLDGNRVASDEKDKPIIFNREGNQVLFNQQGKPIVFDKDGNQIVFDKLGNPIVFNDKGNPIVLDKTGNAVVFETVSKCMNADGTLPPLLDIKGNPIQLLRRDDTAIQQVDSSGNALPSPGTAK